MVPVNINPYQVEITHELAYLIVTAIIRGTPGTKGVSQSRNFYPPIYFHFGVRRFLK